LAVDKKRGWIWVAMTVETSLTINCDVISP
jgi:hypothetical protein